MTPQEIIESKFKTKFIGYDAGQVTAFLQNLAGDMEELLDEETVLKNELARVRMDLESFKAREESVIAALKTTQQLCDDMRKNTERECRLVLSEAEMKADNLLSESRKRLADIENDIMEMRRQKVRFEESLRSTLTTHFKLLDLEKEDAESKNG